MLFFGLTLSSIGAVLLIKLGPRVRLTDPERAKLVELLLMLIAAFGGPFVLVGLAQLITGKKSRLLWSLSMAVFGILVLAAVYLSTMK
jgi:hypothetical protein